MARVKTQTAEKPVKLIWVLTINGWDLVEVQDGV